MMHDPRKLPFIPIYPLRTALSPTTAHLRLALLRLPTTNVRRRNTIYDLRRMLGMMRVHHIAIPPAIDSSR